MDARLRTRIEVETLHALLPELDHYRILGLAENCPQADIDAAVRAESRRLHPDRVAAGGSADLRTRANDNFKAVSEAGRVLRDPDARAAYDASRKGGGKAAEEEARRAAEAAKDPAKAARTPKGEKHWKMALQNWNDEDYNGAAMNIQFALQFEPQNETFKEWLTKAKDAWNEKKRGKGSTYKIRLG